MNRRRALALTLAVVAVCAMTVGSMGFSSVNASRDVSVSIVDDEDAYIGVEACEMANTNSSGNNGSGSAKQSENGRSTKVYVTNQYTDAIDVDVQYTDSVHVDVDSSEKSIKSGHQKHFNVNADIGDSLMVHATGDGIDARIHVTVENDCS